MADRSGRLIGAFALLVGLWIAVYWLWQPPEERVRVSFAEARPPVTMTAPPTGEGRPAGPVETIPETPETVRIVPPAFREYVVQPGDTFREIARKELGSASLESAIARANPLRDPRRLAPGQVVRIPLDPGNIQGVVEGQSPPATPPRDPASGTLPPGVVEYVVQRNDTLGRIAVKFYGTARAADRILEANRDHLSSPDRIRVGQTLRIPSPEFPRGDGGSRR